MLPQTVRVGVTGLARAGKTAFLTSVAANLLAFGAGRPVLPTLTRRLDGRTLRVTVAPAGADEVPRFDYARHLAALATDPPHWPARTDAASLLALDLQVDQSAFGLPLPPRRIRLELLDYPGEWLLDLPLLGLDYATWSAQVLRRLGASETAPLVQDFLSFAASLPARAPRDESLAETGHALYRAALERLRDEAGLSLLQPGRFLMPPPGEEPPWTLFFPARGEGGLTELMAERYARYVDAVRDDLVSPLFGNLDRIVVLADLLTALAHGPVAFADARDALGAAAGALRWRRSWAEIVLALSRLRLPPAAVERVAYVATKADHVAAGQRANLAELTRALTVGQGDGDGDVVATHLTAASVRCTQEATWLLEGRAVSAVEGKMPGKGRVRSYPGEVPPGPPDAGFWEHPFFELPEFEPPRLPEGGRAGVPHLNLDALLTFLLDDLL